MILNGILLYRDGFRIRPYGEVDTIGFDWVGIEKKELKIQLVLAVVAYIMQANQLSGYVNITKEKNGGFEDQANREGLKIVQSLNILESVILKIVKDFSSVRSRNYYFI